MDAQIAKQRAAVLAMQFFRVCGDLTDPKPMPSHDVNSVLDSLKEACAASGQDVVTVLKTAGAAFADRNPDTAERIRTMFR